MKKIIITMLVCCVSVAWAQVSHNSSPGTAINSNTCVDNTSGAGGITDTIVFAETGTISDVDVRVEIDHTWRGDLQFDVSYSGGGGNVYLAGDHDGSGDNYYATFDDEAGTTCATTCGVTTNCVGTATAAICQPNSPLTAFDGLTSPGTWTLSVCDDAGGDEGTFQFWEMTVSGSGGLPVELQGFSVE